VRNGGSAGLTPFLQCDPEAKLTSAIGMKKPGPGKGTTRGVVVLGTDGKVKVWEQAGPQRTLDVVLDFVKGEAA
jgi:alkyl hydroperoxide reductase subunit AhpC